MTLVWGNALHQPGISARTHVFIIGVGRYRHLFGGTSPTQGVPPLGQLKSPPISARELARWFIGSQLVGSPAPLGSVELLLSDSNSQDFNGTLIDDATSTNIQTAFDRWKDRCDGDPNNVAVFHFCGHGLQKDVMALLPEDFALSKNTLWKAAINFDQTYAGMNRCRAGTQLFVIDACRELSQVAILDPDFGGTTLISPRLGESHRRTAPKLFGTAIGLRAFGDPNGVSRLTAALIECLDGLGATDEGPDWVIDTLHLGAHVQKLVKHQNEVQNIPEEDRQIVDPAGGDFANGSQRLRVLPGGSPPTVIVNLGCNPDLITHLATFYAEPVGGQRRQAAASGRWMTKLPAGSYVLGCLFSLQNGPDVPTPPVFVRPPIWNYPINIPATHPLFPAPPPLPPPS